MRAFSSELHRLLAEAIEKLPSTDRIVIRHYYHAELTLHEISKVVSLHANLSIEVASHPTFAVLSGKVPATGARLPL